MAENFPCELLILDKHEAPGLQMGLINEGYMIPKASRNKAETKRYLNWFINPENNEEYNKAIGAVPVNLKSKPAEFAQRFSFKTKEDRERFTRKFAFEHMTTRNPPHDVPLHGIQRERRHQLSEAIGENGAGRCLRLSGGWSPRGACLLGH